MPQFIVGNMWEVFDTADHFIVLSNSTLTSTGAVVMTAGMAAELVGRFPDAGIQTSVGKFIAENGGAGGIFGCRCQSKVGVFQDRRHYRDPTDLGCVSTSTSQLMWRAQENPTHQYHLEQPGQGEPWWLIKDILARLPDNVTIWSRP